MSNLTASGSSDLFIQKLDPNGNFLWVKYIGGSAMGEAIKLDPSGNIYVTGTFINTTDFDPGPGVFNLTGTGNRAPFILKLNINGDFVWAKSFSTYSASYVEHSECLHIDANGNLYLTGDFSLKTYSI